MISAGRGTLRSIHMYYTQLPEACKRILNHRKNFASRGFYTGGRVCRYWRGVTPYCLRNSLEK